MFKKNRNPIGEIQAVEIACFVFLLITVTASAFKASNEAIYVPAICCFCLALLSLGLQKERQEWRSLRYILLLFLIPQMVLYFYSWVLYYLFGNPLGYPGTNITGFAPIMLSFALAVIYRDRSITAIVTAFIVVFIFQLISVFITYGFDGILASFKNIVVNFGSDETGLTKNYFEIHDATFASGVILLYVIVDRRFQYRKYLFASILLFLVIIGMKRIEILAIFVALAVSFVFANTSHKYPLTVGYGCILTLISFLFVGLVLNGVLLDLIGNVNLMGRNYYWSVADDYAVFDPSYLGMGRNSVTHLFQTDLSYMKVHGIHSDILKMYMEAGFQLFFAWLVYLTLYLPKKLCDRFNDEGLIVLFTVIVTFLFVLYTTDNVENYLLTQTCFISVISHRAIHALNSSAIEDKECKDFLCH